MSEYMTFDEVLDYLQVDADELKRMIKDRELSAFKDGGEVKFRAADVKSKKKGLETEPTIILPSDSAIKDSADMDMGGLGASDSDIKIGIADSADMNLENVPTVELNDDSQSVTEEIEFQQQGEYNEDDTVVTQEMGKEETLADEDVVEEEESGARTEALKFTDEIDKEAVEEEVEEEEEEAPRKGRKGIRGRARAEAMGSATPVWVMILLGATFLTVLVQVFVSISTWRNGQQSEAVLNIKPTNDVMELRTQDRPHQTFTVPTGMVTDIGQWFAENLAGMSLLKEHKFPSIDKSDAAIGYDPTFKADTSGVPEQPLPTENGTSDGGASDGGMTDGAADGSTDGSMDGTTDGSGETPAPEEGSTEGTEGGETGSGF